MSDGEPTEPVTIPEPPPFRPDRDLIGDMQRGEKTAGTEQR